MSRIKNWTKMTNANLWEQWRSSFTDDEEATVVAIWIGNRLVKDKAVSTHRKFYSLKDEWILRHEHQTRMGRFVREEKHACRSCNGTGQEDVNGEYDEYGYWEEYEPHETYKDICSACEGTGIYSTSILYEHIFEIVGQRYSFHSYVKPQTVSEEHGADCESYGGRFTEQELEEMALPMSGILKVLDEVARTRWKLTFDKYAGRYVR